jgi:prophage antirepressor-like protein
LNNITPFSFEDHSVRTLVSNDNEVLFVAKDVAAALGYSDTAQAVRQHCRKTKSLKDIGVVPGTTLDTQTKMIPESDVYRLTLKSTLESAERFQDWLVEEVLPALRKHGMYIVQSTKQEMLTTFKQALEVAELLGFRDNMKSLSADGFMRAHYNVSILNSMSPGGLIAEKKALTYTPTELGKMLNPEVSARMFNKLLMAEGLQYKTVDSYEPTEMGLDHCEVLDTQRRHSNGAAVKQVKWFKSVLDIINLE